MRPSQVEDKRYPQVKQAMQPAVVQELLNKRLTEANSGVRFSTLNVSRPDLETVFLSMTGRSLRD